MFLENKKIVTLALVVLNLITVASLSVAYYFYKDSRISVVTSNVDAVIANNANEENNEEEITSETFFVEIKGAVKNPGVYELSKGSIINDLVNAAGGFKSNAYTSNINMSKALEKELVVYVFTKTEYNKKKTTLVASNTENSVVEEVKTEETIEEVVTSSKEECTSNGYLIDNCTDEYISVINSSDSAKPTEETANNSSNTNSTNATTSSKININTATVAELTNLPGVGEKKAMAIVEYRNTNGKFKSTSDITNVSGIGTATYEKFKDLITV
jgi:competence protein ComEA